MARPKGTVRERDFTDNDYKMIEKYGGLGLTIEMIASLFDVSKATFERMMKRDEKINDAILKGRSTALHNVAATAYQMAVSGKQPAMTMFYLKVRGRWSEPRETPISPDEEKPKTEITLNYKPKKKPKKK